MSKDDHKFNRNPYKIEIDKLIHQIQENNYKNIQSSKEKCRHIESLISVKMEKCIQAEMEINKVHKDISEMQMELSILGKEENLQSQIDFGLKDAIKDACQNNEEFRSLTQKIQLNLGFKLKLHQDQGNLWTAKFLFDSKETESNHFIVVVYNAQNDSFMLRDMQPKPNHFTEVACFLTKTNDIAGLLYNCWKYFHSDKKNLK